MEVQGKTATAQSATRMVRLRNMVKQTQLALNDAAEWLGDFHPLAEQLGSAAGLVPLSSVSARLCLKPVQDLASLSRFLKTYQREILLPLELPAIKSAHAHAEKNELRELLAFDRALSHWPQLQEFSEPSRRVGQAQLQKLRPLRDQRFVQRYLHAVEAGEAHGWHTLVYGLTLALYSLPLHQGLLGYAHQTTRGFIYSAASDLQLSEHECRDLFDDLCFELPHAIVALIREPITSS
jgi:urease accessory protein UreF